MDLEMARAFPATRVLRRGFGAIGIVAIGAGLFGVVTDVRSFDRTKGGYEPPYTDYTGEPIDWTTVETTATGLRKSGYVMDFHVNCTSGMIRIGLLSMMIRFRELSPRALVVQKPREACAERGFAPEF